jgi:hypothetical protein
MHPILHVIYCVVINYNAQKEQNKKQIIQEKNGNIRKNQK